MGNVNAYRTRHLLIWHIHSEYLLPTKICKMALVLVKTSWFPPSASGVVVASTVKSTFLCKISRYLL